MILVIYQITIFQGGIHQYPFCKYYKFMSNAITKLNTKIAESLQK